MARIGIIGAGAYGTALACVSRRYGNEVVISVHEAEVASAVNRVAENPLFLKGARLPQGIRATKDLPHAASADLLLVHRSMKEATGSVGATQMRIFRDITFPKVWKGILVGALFSFMTSLQEASTTLFLTLGGWEMMPFGIFTFYISGSQNEAAALGFILIMVAAVSLFVINRIAGTKVGGLFG